MIYAIQNLAYSKRHIYYMLLICSMTSLFWNFLYPSVIHSCVTVTCDRCVIVIYNITLNLNPKSKNKKIKKK